MRLGGCIGCPKLFPLRSTKWTCEDQVLHFWTSPKPQKNLQISLKFIKTNKKYGIKCKRCEKKLKILHKKEKKIDLQKSCCHGNSKPQALDIKFIAARYYILEKVCEFGGVLYHISKVRNIQIQCGYFVPVAPQPLRPNRVQPIA